jgi:class 3 adenylate cyclase
MQCVKCEYANPEDALFCMKCGAKIENHCAACQTLNPFDANFCKKCGAALRPGVTTISPRVGAGAAAEQLEGAPSRESVEVLEGERKTVTALFADIKGSMELMEDLDPEDARAIVDPALKLMMDAVHRYRGYIVQSTGDGIFALFGAPAAHEDHPQRALYAALRMQEEMRRIAERLRAEKGLNLQVRVGANVGDVVVRSIQTGKGQVEYTPIGHSISLASRLQTLANPGSIAISDGLHKLVEGYFTLKALGPARIKGSSGPVNVYEVRGLGPLRTRLQRAAGRGLTKFVGREREMEALRRAAELAQAGRGQIVAAIADPGVGKSRLFYEFKATSASGWMVLEALSISHGKATAYLPVIDLLRNYFEISIADDERKRREKVAGKIAILDRRLEDILPYLFGLLGLVESDDPLAQIDSHFKKRRMLEAIKRTLLRESLNQPLMVIFEDLHWMDGESEALLNQLADSIATSRILLLVNYRPEYIHKWGSKTYYTQLRLDPLGKESADEMLSMLLGSDASLAPLKRLISEKTEGNPLFMEEIVLSLFEDNTLEHNGEVKLAKPFASLRIPPTVQGILASRIDRLPADQKELLQTVAVIGTEFNFNVVRAICGKSDDQLNRLLSALQLAEFIYEQPATGDVEYTFKHALTHDVAYNSLLADQRKVLHERTGRAIETLYAERLEDHLTQLAHHFDHGDNTPKAVEYLSRSGFRAAQQVAQSEAIRYFNRSLELLRGFADGPARDRRELDIQIALSWSMAFAIGLRAPERESALVRARELSERLGDEAKGMEPLLALAHLHFNRRQYQPARELAEKVLSMAEASKAAAVAGGANVVLGWVRASTGQLVAARKHMERAVELFGAGSQIHGAFVLALEAPNFLADLLVVLGYPASASSRNRDLLRAARQSADGNASARCLFAAGIHQVLLRDTNKVAEYADEILSIVNEQENLLGLLGATFLRGWAMAAAGRSDEGIAEMRRSVSHPMVAKGQSRP